MPRPPIDFAATTTALLANLADLPHEANSPLQHYRRSASDAWNLVEYFSRNVSRTHHYAAAFQRHVQRLRVLVIANIIGAFERFLKELAAACLEHIADFVLDGRLDPYTVKGNVLAAHFAGGSVGRALCEADTWLNCKDINDRFRRLLADPFDAGGFYVFPGPNQNPADQRFRLQIMAALFQLRHTAVHNLGVITRSDAAKLQQLVHSQVACDRVLAPTSNDVRDLKRFVDETAATLNDRVADRLRLPRGLEGTWSPAKDLTFNAAPNQLPVGCHGIPCIQCSASTFDFLRPGVVLS